MKKDIILDNIDFYSSQELVKFIIEGTITFRDLCEETNGFLSRKRMREIRLLLETESIWNEDQINNTEEGYEWFLEAYPESKYADEARYMTDCLYQV